jgi:hypothetical protein
MEAIVEGENGGKVKTTREKVWHVMVRRKCMK